MDTGTVKKTIDFFDEQFLRTSLALVIQNWLLNGYRYIIQNNLQAQAYYILHIKS